MTGDEYIKCALRTESDKFCIDMVSPRIIHAAAGIVTEAGELLEAVTRKRIDKINIIEELGDITWYSALMMDALGLAFDDLGNITNVRVRYVAIEVASDICIEACRIQDVIKRGLFYGEIDYDRIRIGLRSIYAILNAIAVCEGATLSHIWNANIKKLKGRYPDKFDVNRSLDRDINTERDAIESSLI